MKFSVNLFIPSLHNFQFLEMNRENQVLNRKNSADLWLFSSFLLLVQNSMAIHHKDKNLSIEISIFTTSHYDPARCQSISKNASISLSYRRVRYNTYNIIFTILNVKLQFNINQSLEVLHAPTNRCTRSLAWFHFPYKRNFLLMQHVTFSFYNKTLKNLSYAYFVFYAY